MNRRFLLSIVVIVSLAACGLGPQGHARSDPALDDLFTRLAQAPDAETATIVERSVWQRWGDSGSATVDILLERASAADTAGDSELALSFLDQASALAPEYAEPWNRRANIAYRSEDYAGAIRAIQETLRREPRHFAAMAALGLIYEEMGQDRRAIEAFRAALAIHPFYQVALEGVRRLEPRIDGRDA